MLKNAHRAKSQFPLRQPPSAAQHQRRAARGQHHRLNRAQWRRQIHADALHGGAGMPQQRRSVARRQAHFGESARELRPVGLSARHLRLARRLIRYPMLNLCGKIARRIRWRFGASAGQHGAAFGAGGQAV